MIHHAMVVSLDATKEYMWVDCQFVIFSSWKIWLWGEISRKSPSPQPVSVRSSDYICGHSQVTEGCFPAFSHPSCSHGLTVGLLICVMEPAGWGETLHLFPSGRSFHLLIFTCLVYSQTPDLTAGFTFSEIFPVTVSEVMCIPNNHLCHSPSWFTLYPSPLGMAIYWLFPLTRRDFVHFITVFPTASTGPGRQWVPKTLLIQQPWKKLKKQRRTGTRELNENRWVCHFFQ